MDRERLKQIIIEEVLRALRERATANPGAAAGSDAGILLLPPSPDATLTPPPAARAESLGPGMVLLTGIHPPEPEFLAAITHLQTCCSELVVLPSLSFRQSTLQRDPAALRGLPLVADPDDEAALASLVFRCEWMVVPDVSINTLHKAILGIEDSAPSRAIASALAGGVQCLFAESPGAKPPASPGRPARIDLLRRMLPLGAAIGQTRNLHDELRNLLHPAKDRPYVPAPPPRPSAARRIITKEDVYEASLTDGRTLAIPAGAIVTSEAREDAARRGVTLQSGDSQ